MDFEKISTIKNEKGVKDKTAKIAQDYYKQFPEGLMRDAEKALNQAERLKCVRACLKSPFWYKMRV